MQSFEGPFFKPNQTEEPAKQNPERPAGIPENAVETTNENGDGTRTFRLEVKGMGKARTVQEWILDANRTLTHTTTTFNWLGKQASVRQVTTAQGNVGKITQESRGGGTTSQEVVVRSGATVKSITQRS